MRIGSVLEPTTFSTIAENAGRVERKNYILRLTTIIDTGWCRVNGRKRGYGQQKRWLWNTGQRNCIYCGLKLTIAPNQRNSMTPEHLKPLSRGGYNKRSNYAPACKGCNNGKGSATVEEFARNIIRRPAWESNRPPRL